MAEAAVALGLTLFAGLAALEAMHWQAMRQLAYVALIEAARAGAAGHAHPALMARAFEAALLPRYASPGDAGQHQARALLRAAHDRAASRAGMPAWRIWVLQPGPGAHADFGQQGLATQPDARRMAALPGALPAGSIRNDYQAEQHAANLARGWPGGRGPRSGLDIYEANLLRVRLLYLVEPWSPLLQPVLRALSGLATSTCAARVLAQGMLPLQLDLEMDMQSHAARWPAQAQVGPGPEDCS